MRFILIFVMVFCGVLSRPTAGLTETFEAEPLSSGLQCGGNYGSAWKKLIYTGVIINVTAKSNKEMADNICSKKFEAFVAEKSKKMEEATAQLECPAHCNESSSYHSNTEKTLFAFEQGQHVGESDERWHQRREEAILRAIEAGECGETEEEHALCREGLALGDFTIYICLGSFNLRWQKICSGHGSSYTPYSPLNS
jgi:hypothetical protein